MRGVMELLKFKEKELQKAMVGQVEARSRESLFPFPGALETDANLGREEPGEGDS
jgi:hypothetical protein